MSESWLVNEYHELLEEIIHRRRNTWVIISILLAGTFVISFVDSPIWISIRYLLSLFLVLFSWFLWYSAGKVNAECWKDRREIEDRLGKKMNQARKKRLEKTLTYRIRAIWWHILFLTLFLFYFHMILIEGLLILRFICR